jgi:hypothetical protein
MTTARWRHFRTERLTLGRSRLHYLIDERQRATAVVREDPPSEKTIGLVGAELARSWPNPPRSATEKGQT